ncbi:MAG: alpha/beta hydrolase [Clostridia bacterium]|nr:alpha/beta hydrolase [Clostridia bacterium]
MPTFEYRDLNINYTRSGNGKTLLFLHGWGANLDSFKVLTDDLVRSYEVVAIDFPGFGLSDTPQVPWNLTDYTEMTVAFIKHLELKSFIPIGHSFGGRVAIRLTEHIGFDKLVLISSAGIKPSRKPEYYFKVYGYKAFKYLAKLPVLSWILEEPLKAYRDRYSSSDYKQASDIMKQVLSKVVNEDLRHLLPKVKASTLLMWGDQDTSTPLNDAKLMESLIPDAGLVVFEGAGHFSYLEQSARFLTILKTFIGG